MPDLTPYVTPALAAELVSAYKGERLTQAKLVEATGISPTTMQRLLAGKSVVEVPQLIAIAKAVKVDADELLARAERRARRLAQDDGVSEGPAHNVTDLRNWTAEQIDDDRTEARAANPRDEESDTDETE